MHFRQIATLFAALVLVGALTACGGDSSGPAAFSYSGNWSGMLNDSIGGAGTTTVTMSQSGTQLVGTWQTTFAAGGTNSGTLQGTVRTNDVLIELYPSDPSTCPFALVAQRSGSTLSGTYAAFNCTVAVSGTMSITKQ